MKSIAEEDCHSLYVISTSIIKGAWHYFIVLILLCASSFQVLAAAGDLDTSFGTSGIVLTAVGSGHDIGTAIAVQPDDKILLTGYLDTLDNGGADDFAVVRYNPDGSLDTGFGSNGIAVTDLGEDGDSYSIAVQADGKILLGGQISDDMSIDFAIARYTSNGVLDNTFDSDGIVRTNVSSPADQGFSIAIQPDGKILLGGIGFTFPNTHYTLVRYKPDGSLDPGFGVNGIVITNVVVEGGGAPYGSIVVQPDGKILFIGQGNALVRYNSDGSLDDGFGSNGTVTSAIEAYSIVLQTDGKIVAGGYVGDGFDHDFAVARYNVNGTLDVSFDGDGVRTENFSATWDEATFVVVQPDGKILLNGFSESGKILVRYNSDGSLDTSFDGDGILITVGYANRPIALQSDGQILLGGYAFGSNDLDFQLVRYLNDDDGHLAQLTPTSFSFTDQTDVELNALQTSENININGLGNGNAVPVTVVGGEYAINGGSYSTEVGYVSNGDQISVRHVSAGIYGTEVNTTLSVGGLHANNNLAVFLGAQVSDTFTSTTVQVVDTDGDGILDDADNCILVANGPNEPDAGGNIQLDTDSDGYGNICDPDFDNNLVVNASDLAYFKTKFFSSDPDADLNGDGVVNAADLAILKTMFFKPPGPSGLVP